MNFTKIDSRTHVIVTGGAGFIGSSLSARCLSAGAQVTILTRHVHTPRAVQLAKQGANIIACDFSTPDGLPDPKMLPRAQVFCHLAADVAVSSHTLRATNVDGTHRALQLADALNVPYFVYASSIEAQGLGSQQEIPLGEERPCRPESDYGVSKADAEALVKKWSQSSARDTLILRIGNIYGPGSVWLIEPSLAALLGHRPLHHVWNQLQHRLFQPLYIDDLIDGFMRTVQQRLTGVYNITGEEPVSIAAYLRKLGALTRLDDPFVGNQACHRQSPRSPGAIAPDFAYLLMGSLERCHRSYDNTKLRAQIGHYASWSLPRGLAATLRWYRQSGSLAALCRAIRQKGIGTCMSH